MTTFNTNDYFNTHCKTPKGQGCWAFSTEPYGKGEMVFAPFSTYAAAKKWVKVHSPDVTTFYVCG